jgi:hypothetical protein
VVVEPSVNVVRCNWLSKMSSGPTSCSATQLKCSHHSPAISGISLIRGQALGNTSRSELSGTVPTYIFKDQQPTCTFSKQCTRLVLVLCSEVELYDDTTLELPRISHLGRPNITLRVATTSTGPNSIVYWTYRQR